VIVTVPGATAVAEPVWSAMVATAVFDEVQLDFVVTFCVVPLL
jgi:hypothetical protein